jgi:hypothetical protein
VGSQGSPSPKKAKTQFSDGKHMATIFWDEEILLIQYIIIQSLKEPLKLKGPSAWRQKNLLPPDNRKAHKACNVQAGIQERGFTELRHPPYNPDCDFFLFKKVKKQFRGRNFTTEKELKTVLMLILRGFRKNFFLKG